MPGMGIREDVIEKMRKVKERKQLQRIFTEKREAKKAAVKLF